MATRAPTSRQLTLAAFREEWRQLYASTQLSPRTQRLYDYLWAAQLEHALGASDIAAIGALDIERWKAQRLAAGTGPETVSRTLTMLQGIFARAVEWGYLEQNPVARVRRPRGHRRRLVRPLAPLTVERLRHEVGRFSTDAVLISVLAYAGLRPGEALGLTWGAVGERVILVEQAASLGRLCETKTRATRSVRLLPSLVEDLNEHRRQQGIVTSNALVFPDRSGTVWTDSG